MKNALIIAMGTMVITLTNVNAQQRARIEKQQRKLTNLRSYIKMTNDVINGLVDQIPGDTVQMRTQLLTDMQAWSIMSRNNL